MALLQEEYQFGLQYNRTYFYKQFQATQAMIEIKTTNFLVIKVLLAYGIVGSTAAILLYLLVLGGNSQLSQNVNFSKTEFNFQVYCPINSKQTLKNYINSFGENMKLLQNTNLSSLYIIFMESKSLKDADSNLQKIGYGQKGSQMHYCGLAREWNGDCSNAKLICSSPGPMFYLPINNQVTIIWVNNIKAQRLQQWTEQACFNYNTNDESCQIAAKYQHYNDPVRQGCSFYQPTDYGFSSIKVAVNKSQIPYAPYIHGLQVRPAFSGNPLSWFNSKGDIGIGFFSLNNSQYFDQFKENQFNSIKGYNKDLRMRIMKANNKQMPGVLLYYDNAIKMGKQNIAAGLSGLYILYNQSAEAILPSGQHQKIILFSHHQKLSSLQNKSPEANMYRQAGKKDEIYIRGSENEIYERNVTYRFRIINGHINSVYSNISFVIYCSDPKAEDLSNAFQIDPETISNNLEYYMKVLNFTVIGSDSALFNVPITKVKSIDLEISQRLQVLMELNEENGVPSSVYHFYSVYYDENMKQYCIKQKFEISKAYKQNRYKGMNQIMSIPVPYTSLKEMSTEAIDLLRMKSIIGRPDGQFTSINGRYQINQGKTDKVKIGSVQNWYLINNNQEPYPFQLGFLNFQMVQSYSLKLTREGCTFYQLDFFRMSQYEAFFNLSNKDLCYQIGNMTKQQVKKVYEEMKTLDLQNQINFKHIGKVTGLNVMEYIVKVQDTKKYGQMTHKTSCNLKHLYKYICQETTSSIPEWNKRWKDSTKIRPYMVSVLRIRWTSTVYNQKVEKYPYFSIPEDHLEQFPGYFYQGLTFPGKDTENIRPFMFQHSDAYLQERIPKIYSVKTYDTSIFSWHSKVRSINSNLQCNI